MPLQRQPELPTDLWLLVLESFGDLRSLVCCWLAIPFLRRSLGRRSPHWLQLLRANLCPMAEAQQLYEGQTKTQSQTQSQSQSQSQHKELIHMQHSDSAASNNTGDDFNAPANVNVDIDALLFRLHVYLPQVAATDTRVNYQITLCSQQQLAMGNHSLVTMNEEQDIQYPDFPSTIRAMLERRRCSNSGCLQYFCELDNRPNSCRHHPGRLLPTKTLSCCRARSFKSPGCKQGYHDGSFALFLSQPRPSSPTSRRDIVPVVGLPAVVSSAGHQHHNVTADVTAELERIRLPAIS